MSTEVSMSYLFRNAISTIPTHNYLNQAYHEANLHFLCPPSRWEWTMPAIFVPPKVRRLLDFDVIADQLLTSIASAFEVVEEAKSFLDKETTHRVAYYPDGPHPWMHHDIQVSRHEAEGFAPCWDFSFNGYTLGLALLGDYKKFIEEMKGSERSQFTRISLVHQMASLYEDSARLVESDLDFHTTWR